MLALVQVVEVVQVEAARELGRWCHLADVEENQVVDSHAVGVVEVMVGSDDLYLWSDNPNDSHSILEY